MKVQHLLYVAGVALLASCGGEATTETAAITEQAGAVSTLNNEMDSVSYAIGVNIGTNFKNQEGLETVNLEAVFQGVKDANGGAGLMMDEQMAGMYVQSYFQKVQNRQFEKNITEGQNFLAQNGQRAEVTTLPSGLQYEVMNEGTGAKPTATDNVTTHYHGTLIDGTVFDSSVDRGQPASFNVSGVIPGWTEALQLMSVGSKWKLYVPSELAYGANPRPGGPIQPHMMLIFEVELLSID